MGVFEWPAFADGTKAVAEAVAQADAFSVVGGADSIRALNELGLLDNVVSWASTGGGAALELLEGKELPGVAVIPGLGERPPERDDLAAVDGASARLRGEIEPRARRGVVVRDELEARVRPDEAGHLRDVDRIVEAPHAPFGDRERLGAMSPVERLCRGPLGTVSRLVVEVVRDHVHVGVAREDAAAELPRTLGAPKPCGFQTIRSFGWVEGKSPWAPGRCSRESFAFISSAVPPRAMIAIRANAFRSRPWSARRRGASRSRCTRRRSPNRRSSPGTGAGRSAVPASG